MERGRDKREKLKAVKVKHQLTTHTQSRATGQLQSPFSKGASQPGGVTERWFTSTPTHSSLPRPSLSCVSLEDSFSS